MSSRLHRVFAKARLLAESMLDVLRPVYRMPPAYLAGRPSELRPNRLRERARAVNILLKAVGALGIPWSCRRSAFLTYRALQREGVPSRLCFGVRRARRGEASACAYVGHVWTRNIHPEEPAAHDREEPDEEFPLTLFYPHGNAGWRRG